MADALAAASGDTDLEARAASFHEVIDISQQEAMFVPADPRARHQRRSRDGIGGFQPTLYGKPDLSFLWIE